MGLTFVVILLSNNVFAQTLHNRTLYEMVKQTPELEKKSQIDVGEFPSAIAVEEFTDTVYVANAGFNSVSVIDGIDNTKIGEDIPVGKFPSAIAVEEFTDTVYVANYDSNSVSVISAENNTKIGEDIPVGDSPSAIAVDEFTDTVYVANAGFNSVSVIDGIDNTKIGEDIIVGAAPIAIAINNNTNTVYVANYGSNSVSVIFGGNNTKIGEDIIVGAAPIAIAINNNTNTVYVANYDSNSVSVISAENNTKIGEDIIVGDSPSAIAVDEFTDTVYVANAGSNSVSVIDSAANKVVAGIILHVSPFNSGYIVCDDLTTPSPTAQYFYVYSGAECTAKPNGGFEFVSWEENLGGNSTQLIKLSRPASTLDSFLEFLRIKSPDEPEAKLPITKFGTFTANFKELPPPVPQEFWLQSYVLVGTVVAGLSIPSIVGWIKSKMDARKLNYYHKEIAALYGDDGKLNENDIEPLNRLRSSILDAYSKGKINEKHYESLKNETSILYEKIFRNRINDSLNNNNPSNKKTTEEQLAQIRNELEYAYSEGKLNEKHYTNLVNNISMLYQEVFKKEIDSLGSSTNNEDKMKLLNKLHSDIEDAYSKDKVTEKHYNLLKEKISDYENSNSINS
jgi:YVTN family beta-propeller protein